MTRNSCSRGCAAGATLTPRARLAALAPVRRRAAGQQRDHQPLHRPAVPRPRGRPRPGRAAGPACRRGPDPRRPRVTRRPPRAPPRAPCPRSTAGRFRSRLAQRANSVVMRILTDLSLSRQGREVARTALRTGSGPNVQAVTQLLNMEIRAFTGKAREALTADETEAAFRELDNLGDAVRDRIREALGRPADAADPQVRGACTVETAQRCRVCHRDRKTTRSRRAPPASSSRTRHGEAPGTTARSAHSPSSTRPTTTCRR